MLIYLYKYSMYIYDCIFRHFDNSLKLQTSKLVQLDIIKTIKTPGCLLCFFLFFTGGIVWQVNINVKCTRNSKLSLEKKN